MEACLGTEANAERQRRPGKKSVLAPYQGYLLERCRQGYWNAMGLWREIAALGYSGKYQTVWRLVAYFRGLAAKGLALQAPVKGLTPSEAVGLTLQKPENRDGQSQAKIQALGALAPELGEALSLFERFAAMLRRRESGLLAPWLAAAASCGVAELKGFAQTLRQDLKAVTAGLSLPWSQGQTEGQVTKLKLLRRQMYGRGNFDLVRKRLLHVA